MSRFNRLRFWRFESSDQHATESAAELRQHVGTLEADLAEVSAKIADIRTRAAAVERRAMDAIRAGDDRGARDALVEQHAHTEDLAALEADAQVLRAILSECYDSLKISADGAGPVAQDLAPPA